MDKDKLIKKIKENKREQVDKYENSIKKIVKKYSNYYSDKDYASKFK